MFNKLQKKQCFIKNIQQQLRMHTEKFGRMCRKNINFISNYNFSLYNYSK